MSLPLERKDVAEALDAQRTGPSGRVFVVDLQSSLKIIALQWCGAGRPATDGLPQAIVSFPPHPVSQIRAPSGQCGVMGPSTL